MGKINTMDNTGRQVELLGGAVVEDFCDSFQAVELLEEKNRCVEKEANEKVDEFSESVFLVADEEEDDEDEDDDGDEDEDDDDQSPETAITGTGSRRPEPEVARDRALELVALRLRRIGDEMDVDIRRTGSSRMTSQRRRRRRDATGYPVAAPSLFLDLFPGPPRKGLVVVVGDLACETLLRDLVAHVTVGDVIVAAGRALTRSVVYELVSTVVTCPDYFRSEWSFAGWTGHWSIS